MTPKRTLLDHLLEHHQAMVDSPARRPAGARGNVRRLNLRQLQLLHAEDHHRYRLLDHHHWDGTDTDRNVGASHRPNGWRTGLDVVARPRPARPRPAR